MKKIKRYELLINGIHYGYYKNKKSIDEDLDSFYLCKPKWFDTYEEYEEALEYREKAKIEIIVRYLED